VGQTEDIRERWKDHIYDAFHIPNPNKKYNRKFYFQNAIAKYGVDAFTWQIIDELETLDQSNEAEEFYIAYLNTIAHNGYNILPGGKNRKVHQATKDKISETLKKTSCFIGKSGKDHPNFGTKRSEEDRLKQSQRLSGDNGPGKKINSQIARQIFLDFLADQNQNIDQLGQKYGIKKGAIRNILTKKCWKDATKDLSDIKLSDRKYGERCVKSKLKEVDAISIIEKYKTGNYTMEQLSDEYNLSGSSIISNIVNGKSWKHIKR